LRARLDAVAVALDPTRSRVSRSARAGILTGLVLAGCLLAPSPASAAPGDPVPLFEPGPSPRYDVLQPLGQTATGLVWRVEGQSGLLVKLTGGATTREDRLTDPVLKGDLITSLDEEAGSITWRTIADAGLHQHEIPDGIEYTSRTSRGYLGQRAAGRHEDDVDRGFRLQRIGVVEVRDARQHRHDDLQRPALARR